MTRVIFQNILLIWYSKNGKSYPWRKTIDPYEVLVSEVLLQRTDSQKVEIVYPKFIDKFPSIEGIHNANPEDIKVLINDIGLFYRSARLKKMASEIINKFNGIVPDNSDDLLSLTGIGNYISNAVLCFAFKKRVPIVDTNVIRIYKRVFNLVSSRSRPRTDRKIWDFAGRMLPKDCYVEYNYAILDFASEICKTMEPSCKICPMRKICHYHLISERLN
jgi:A/G-specific adenine glycosylase